MRLVDLDLLRKRLIQRFEDSYSGEEIILPKRFKDEVTFIYADKISYYEYTACVTTKAGLNIFLPNQWFYIASYFTDFYIAIIEYKNIALKLFNPDRLKVLNGQKLSEIEEKKLINSEFGPSEQEFIKKFVTDYNWWGGGKTIDRGDFFESPILNMTGLVNVSQSYVKTLCQFLAEHPELSKMLYDRTMEYSNSSRNFNRGNAHFNQELEIIYRPYVTAIHTKPFVLLAGISGTGKSRIVRELARACDTIDENPWNVQSPANFCLISVKPNWHDSTELLGYVSRISGKDRFISTVFWKFLVRAYKNPDIPFFLCLDEMNLAPVEQYFAEYLSCIESRKLHEDKIITDLIFPKIDEQWYLDFIHEIGGEEIEEFLSEGISIPQNLIVVGTVNMDETTFTFSRKVLDRAMTIEMNDADLWGGLEKLEKRFAIKASQIIGNAVEGRDIYKDNKEECEIVLNYLNAINNALKGTPFRIAYRTRNEFLLYVIENLKYQGEMSKEFCMARALDEVTSMKILSRIEGDDSRLRSPNGESLLMYLQKVIRDSLLLVLGENNLQDIEVLNVCSNKLEEMEQKLQNGYCNFWA
jgi:hypothetical protein